MQSSNKLIFAEHVTQIDAAVLLPGVGVSGISWDVEVMWSGPLDENGIIADFSNAKKYAKAVIDDLFDHRLIVSKKYVREISQAKRCLVSNCINEYPLDIPFAISTATASILVVEDGVLIALSKNDYSLLSVLIAEAIRSESPRNIENIVVKLSKPHDCHAHQLSYLHSQRFNGKCQKFHGHSSVIEIRQNDYFDNEKTSSATKIINLVYAINKEYIKERLSPHVRQEMYANFPNLSRYSAIFSGIEYEGPMGYVGVLFPSKLVLKTDGESTIENISAYIGQKLDLSTEHTIKIYEGCSKGAIWKK